MAVHKKGITGLKKVIKRGDPIEVSCVLGYNYYYVINVRRKCNEQVSEIDNTYSAG